jgi:hypothetical protein
MTDISVLSQQFQAEDLSWDLTEPDQGYDKGGTLAIAAFNQAQHFPNGYIPSGTILCKFTSGANSGLLGPYLDGASAGQGVAEGILKATITVVQPNGALKTKVGCAYRKAFAAVSQARLPLTSAATLGGFIDAAGIADLPLIFFDA